MIELRQLRYFIAVAEERHFSRAAERLCIVQPAVTKSIQKLEDQLGVQLFERNPGNIRLTKAGETLLDHARHVLDEVRLAEIATIQSAREDVPPIRIGFVEVLAFQLFPKALSNFRHRNPHIPIIQEEGHIPSLLTRLKEGNLDFVLANGLRHDPGIDGIEREWLNGMGWSVFVPEHSHLRNAPHLELRDLAGEKFIVPPSDACPPLREYFEMECLQAGFMPDIFVEVSRYHSLLALVACGDGIAVLPDLSQFLDISGVVAIPLRKVPKNLEFSNFIAWRSGATFPVRDFADSVRRCLDDTVVAANAIVAQSPGDRQAVRREALVRD